MDAEQPVRVRPALARRKARSRAEALEFPDRVLVGVLRVYRLALAEADAAPADPDLLRFHAFQVHLDAAARRVVEGAVAERRQVEIGAELAIDASEEVQIESGGDAARVVVGGVEPRRVLLEIDPDQEAPSPAQLYPGARQKRGGFGRGQIADGRTRKIHDAAARAETLQ